MARSINARSIIGFILLLLLSGTFVFSAVAKFITIEPFEWTFMDMGLSGPFSFFLARFFVGFEFLLAFFMLAHVYLKRFTYPLTILFLIAMTLYLVILLATKGNNVDCGCFGDALPMSPVVSILKNLIMLAVILILSRIYAVKPYRFSGIVAAVGTASMMALPFVFVPYEQKPSPINLNALYKDAVYKPAVELRKGKHLVAFLSLGCPHCRKAARIFKDIYAADSTIPIYMVLYGHASDTAEFFKDTKAGKVPHFVYHNSPEFIKMAGQFVPSIFWISNSIKERRVTYVQLSTDLLRNWKKD
ncbi:MAG TPA: MauE/DoxX family redox-associated membrane protein [Chitinophagaceae bacterium]|nr:MauE/DoxX family redox-associated membrane protein [Chitinophagaceae bacterium]